MSTRPQEQTTTRRTLRVLQANVAKSQGSHDAALALADSGGFDVVMLQGPWAERIDGRPRIKTTPPRYVTRRRRYLTDQITPTRPSTRGIHTPRGASHRGSPATAKCYGYKGARCAPRRTDEYQKAHAYYTTLRRIHDAGSYELNDARTAFRRTARDTKKDSWRSTTGNLETSNDIFRVTKWVRGTGPLQPPPLRIDDVVYETQLEWATAFRHSTLERKGADDIPDPWQPIYLPPPETYPVPAWSLRGRSRRHRHTHGEHLPGRRRGHNRNPPEGLVHYQSQESGTQSAHSPPETTAGRRTPPGCPRPLLLPHRPPEPKPERGSKSEETELFLRWLATTPPEAAVVFSDGSRTSNGATGYGYVVYRNNAVIAEGKGRLGRAGVFDAEARGALDGLVRAVTITPKEAPIAVCLDNTSAADCLAGRPSDSSQEVFLAFQRIARNRGRIAPKKAAAYRNHSEIHPRWLSSTGLLRPSPAIRSRDGGRTICPRATADSASRPPPNAQKDSTLQGQTCNGS
ncbi:Endo/exonuclease/phosphatase domain-containing protein [Fusarium sp. Ph1]|nr:Endo/exonuclease/phosphatase domain-containing protein [Fusarium sp. Ph1]